MVVPGQYAASRAASTSEPSIHALRHNELTAATQRLNLITSELQALVLRAQTAFAERRAASGGG